MGHGGNLELEEVFVVYHRGGAYYEEQVFGKTWYRLVRKKRTNIQLSPTYYVVFVGYDMFVIYIYSYTGRTENG